MSATPPQFDLGRSLSDALRLLQQGPAPAGQAAPPAAGQAVSAKTVAGSPPRLTADAYANTAFQKQLKAAHEAGQDGQVRPRGSYVNLSV